MTDLETMREMLMRAGVVFVEQMTAVGATIAVPPPIRGLPYAVLNFDLHGNLHDVGAEE